MWSSSGSFLWPLLFVSYIHDFPPTINIPSETIIFTDGTTVLNSGKNVVHFCRIVILVLSHMSKGFTVHKLVVHSRIFITICNTRVDQKVSRLVP